ncbi:MAG TPA: FAD-dependent oxidoreductase [Ilumatobacter sp.]|nr:FAD-dependent oxidoreductase [Ilumatobacter sp.]
MTNELNGACDVAVVGAGLAGLTAAATAARNGASVTLLDARSPGGRARSATKRGYVLNEGGHALYRQGGGRAVLDGLGVRVAGRSPNVAAYRTVWDGAIRKLPTTAPTILASRLLGLRSKRLLGSWFGDIRGVAAAAGNVSLDEWLDAQRARPDLRKYVLTLGRLTTYSATPETLAAQYVVNQFANGGVDYLDGGWQSIVDELARVADEAGVRIVTGAAASGVERSRSGTWRVATAGGELVAGAVVLAAGGPELATRLLGDDPVGWVERAGPAARAACLDVGGPPGAHEFVLSADEPLYLSLHSAAARLAPPGRALYSLMCYLAPGDPADAAANRAALERHAALAGLPGPADRDIDRFLAAPVVTWGTPQPHTVRPTGLELADRGLLVAGDWVGERLLADASLTSGAAAGRAAAEHALKVAR